MQKLFVQVLVIALLFGVGLTLTLTGQTEAGLALIGSAGGYAAAIFQNPPTSQA